MNSLINDFFPPILLDFLYFLNRYRFFLPYKSLLQKNIELKNIHQGKRCFILGSGPSIKHEDLLPLKNEIVFALNNFYVHDNFQEIMSGDESKYYIVAPIHPPQTEEEWRHWLTDMSKNVSQNITLLFGLDSNAINIKYMCDTYDLFNKAQLYWYYTLHTFKKDSFNKKYIDISHAIYRAETVSIYAIILALYMGFEEIYLLGMDHNYFLYDNENDMRMYKNGLHQKDEFKRSFGDDFYVNEYLRQYNIFTKYSVLQNNTTAKIYNASSEGLLKVFPRVNYNELFKT